MNKDNKLPSNEQILAMFEPAMTLLCSAEYSVIGVEITRSGHEEKAAAKFEFKVWDSPNSCFHYGKSLDDCAEAKGGFSPLEQAKKKLAEAENAAEAARSLVTSLSEKEAEEVHADEVIDARRDDKLTETK